MSFDRYRFQPDPTPFEEECADRAGALYSVRADAASAIQSAIYDLREALKYGERCKVQDPLVEMAVAVIEGLSDTLHVPSEDAIRERLLAEGEYQPGMDRTEEV